MSEENDPHWVDPLAEHDRPWHTHNAGNNHQRSGDETPLRDRPIDHRSWHNAVMDDETTQVDADGQVDSS